jgi:hypothetical protein
MKNDIERDELLADVLAEESQLRAETLERGLAEMRRVRRRRRTGRAVAMCVPILLFAAVCIRVFSTRPMPTDNAAPRLARTEETIPGTSIHVLNDEQLLELFKGRPIALIGPAGNQRLVVFDERAN